VLGIARSTVLCWIGNPGTNIGRRGAPSFLTKAESGQLVNLVTQKAKSKDGMSEVQVAQEMAAMRIMRLGGSVMENTPAPDEIYSRRQRCLKICCGWSSIEGGPKMNI